MSLAAGILELNESNTIFLKLPLQLEVNLKYLQFLCPTLVSGPGRASFQSSTAKPHPAPSEHWGICSESCLSASPAIQTTWTSNVETTAGMYVTTNLKN